MINHLENTEGNSRKINDKVYVAGIDIGSAFSKAVILSSREVVAYHILPSEGDYRLIADRVMTEALEKVGLSINNIGYVMATGYGGAKVSFSNHVANDITCQGKGISNLFPSVRTAVDIGGQFTRVFRVDDMGRVSSFLLSDKCAAGSGRFLQVIARVLYVDLKDIGELSLKSKKKVDFNAGCAVFAESEAISRVAEGAAVADILAGLHRALAAKIESMIVRLGMEHDLALLGGGAKDIGLVRSIEEKMGFSLFVPDEPQIVTAFGAALIAAEIVKGQSVSGM